MRRKIIVDEILPRWPANYWDEFMRQPAFRGNRHCLRPEVSRVFHFGIKGTSGAQFSEIWTNVRTNAMRFDWSQPEMVARMKRAGIYTEYADWITAQINAAMPVGSVRELMQMETSGELARQGTGTSYRLPYSDVLGKWREVASFFHIMPDLKEGLPRGSFKKVLPLVWKGHRIYLYNDWPAVERTKTPKLPNMDVLSGSAIDVSTSAAR
jgi:alpha-1,3-mannosyl-glycoprotein beta-1,2-N-acetylglucosaminyltransferase